MANVATVLDLRNRTLMHGSNADCPEVRSGIWGHCKGHDELRVITFRVALSAADEGSLMRAGNCTQVNVPYVLEGVLAAALATFLDVGARGMQADKLVANGDIEVGRPAQP